jgi:hypothetical protein
VVALCSDVVCKESAVLIESNSAFITLLLGDCVHELRRVIHAKKKYESSRALGLPLQEGCDVIFAFALEDMFTALALSEAAQQLLRVLSSAERGCAF